MKKILLGSAPPTSLAIFNLICLSIAVLCNNWMQVFCNPVPWALLLIALIFISTVLYPLLALIKWIAAGLAFVNGIGFCVYLYCILFLDQMNFLGLGMSLLGLGLVTFVPHLMAWQLLWKQVIKPSFTVVRGFFFMGVITSLLFSLYFGYRYQEAARSMEAFVLEDYQNLKKNYWTEGILGMHLIYHTRFCEYDGWRPPLHDPALNLGRWLNGGYDPLTISLEKRLKLYKRNFPDRTYKFDCSCAHNYRNSYHSDPLWKD